MTATADEIFTNKLPRKLQRLVRRLADEFEGKQSGHCLRVDHLNDTEARVACHALRQTNAQNLQAYVLASETLKNSSLPDELSLFADRAIELRNRKQSSICLFIPATLRDATASSLGNSFAPFAMSPFLHNVIQELQDEIPAELQSAIRLVRRQLRGPASVSMEQEITFLSAVLDTPTLQAIGENLWRVGLIPDFSNAYLEDEIEFSRRLDLNRECVSKLARPSRPQSSVADRIALLRLKPSSIQQELAQFLLGRRLQSDVGWLRDLSESDHRNILTFDAWDFPEAEPSDLEGIEVESFTATSGLKDVGTEAIPYAECGPKQKMTLKWKPLPLRPQNVIHWRIEMIPSRDRYSEEEIFGVDLPQIMVKGSAKTAKLSLDLDAESLPVREVEVRISALDASGAAIIGEDGEIFYGYSTEFYLQAGDGGEVPDKVRRLPTSRCLADAILSYSLTAKDSDLNVEAQPEDERDLLYLPFQLRGKPGSSRHTTRLATTPFLRDLQSSALHNSEVGGRYRVSVRGVDTLKIEQVQTVPISTPAEISEAIGKFYAIRRKLFDALSSKRQGLNGLVEIAELSPSLCKQVMDYAKAYSDLLDTAAENFTSATSYLLELDTLSLDFGPNDNRRATVFLPTHPLRLLWYVAYSKWIEKVAEQLRAMPQRERKSYFDVKSLDRLAPLNLPAFLIRRPNDPNAEVFTDNIGLFYGVCLPLKTDDPGALLSEVARALGYASFEPSLTDLNPQQLTDEIRSYREMHPYLRTLRINAVNPGSGEFLQVALDAALKPTINLDDETTENTLHLDLITHTDASIQTPAAGLETLVSDWYRGGARKRGSHLLPGIQTGRRKLDTISNLPGGDVHLALCQDHYQPIIELTQRKANDVDPIIWQETSAAVFGLLTRFQTEFTSHNGLAEWTRQVAFNGGESMEKHPVNRDYKDLLIEGQESFLRLSACVLNGQAANGRLPVLRLRVEEEERKVVDCLHDSSDWVMTLDRHFGVEYYDSPLNESLDRAAERYLLDYTPEFLDGLGHRLVVTTGWQEEVVGVIGRAMEELGLAQTTASVSELLRMLKMISGRLALRLIGDEKDTLAKETVSLAVVANWLHRRDELKDAILIPVDAHRRLFYEAKEALDADSASRCDLLLVRPLRQRLEVNFIEVKYRQSDGSLTAECDKIADQTSRTEKTLRELFFSEPPRLDGPILRCQLAAILRFYAERARRHGRISNDGNFAEMLTNIARVEMGAVKMVARHTGYIVNLDGQPRKPFKHNSTNTTIHLLTGITLESETNFERSSIAKKPDLENTSSTSSSKRADKKESNSTSTTVVDEATVPFVPNAEQTSKMKVASDEVPLALDMPVPKELTIPLGIDVASEEEVAWVGSVQGSPHLFVLGIPGQGKSWAILRLVTEAAKSQIPSLIIDFHGQFGEANGPLASVSPRIIDITQGLPFSPFEAQASKRAGASYWKANALETSEVFQYICKLGEMQRDLIYEAISSCYKDAGFADNELDETQAALEPPTVADVFARLQILERGRRGAQNTIARCRPLFEFDLFREDDEKKMDFAAIRQQTTVIDLHREGVEALQMAAGAFVLRKLYKDMFSWGYAESLRLLVVLDEAHRLAKDTTLPKLMKEGRKYGIAVIVASQSFHDFHADVLQNAGTKIMFRTNHPLSRYISGYMKSSFRVPDVAAKLESLQVGHALVQTVQMGTCEELAMYPYLNEK